MLTGWKDITKYTGFSRNTIKKLMKNEGFPLQYISTKPVTTQQAILAWFLLRLDRKNSPVKNPVK
jgi:predicted DNA-binding transcriptional regulator AlpA